MTNDQVERILNKYTGKTNAMVQVLLEIQHENHWLPAGVLNRVSKRLGVPLSRIMQLVTFHKTFRLIPKGRNEVHICSGSACFVRGSSQLLDAVEGVIGIRPGETDSETKFSLETGNCLGSCNLGPEIIVEGKHHGKVTPDKIEDVLKNYE
ncbi:complex I 24 kDa subunit family protein [Acidobacteriota bacterium]